MDASINHSVTSIGKCQVFFLYCKLGAPNSNTHNRQLVSGSVGREDIALLLAVVGCSGDSIVDSFANLVTDKGQSCASISDCCVARLVDSQAIDNCRGGGELPEALRVVDRRVVDLISSCIDGILIQLLVRGMAQGLSAIISICLWWTKKVLIGIIIN